MRKATLLLLASACILTGCGHLTTRVVDAWDPLSPAEHVLLGEAYQEHGEKAAAIRQYELALHQDRHQIHALMALGNIAFEDQDWKKSRAYFRRAEKAAPGDPGAVNNLAMVDLAQGKPMEKARRKLEQVLPTAGPTAPYLLETLSTIASREGRYADAQNASELAQDAALCADADLMKQQSRVRLVNRRLTHEP
jgi:Tfp pilus assembly protein PilF